MGKRKEMAGLRFGRLIVIDYSHINPSNRRIMWKCICDCGNEKIADGVYLRNGKVKSCGCLVGEYLANLTRKEDSGFKLLLRQYKSSAKARGYDFDLSEDTFKKLTSGDCFYCGDKPKKVSVKLSEYGKYIFNGIDRLENSLGYSETNCVTCCEDCNFLKRTLNVDKFLNLVSKIYKNRFGEIKNDQGN